jgi:hypothetical protein
MRLIMPKLISISLPKLFIHGHFIVVHGPKHQKTHQLTAVCTQLRSRQQAVRSFRPQNPRILQERLARQQRHEIIGLKHASRTRDDVTALMVCRSKPLPLSRKEVEHLPKNKTATLWDSNSWYEWDSTASASRCSAAQSVGADPPRKRLRTSRTPISRHVAHLCLHVCVTGCVLRTHAHKHTHTHIRIHEHEGRTSRFPEANWSGVKSEGLAPESFDILCAPQLCFFEVAGHIPDVENRSIIVSIKESKLVRSRRHDLA